MNGEIYEQFMKIVAINESLHLGQHIDRPMKRRFHSFHPPPHTLFPLEFLFKRIFLMKIGS
jgi:hypothetical protein